MLAISRTPIKRPSDFDQRLSTTLAALRFVRVSGKGEIVLITEETARVQDNFKRLYPSFATLQLYLLNDTRFGAAYVQIPLVADPRVRGSVDYGKSIAGIRDMVRSLVQISSRLGDVQKGETAAALTRVPALYENYPGVYLLLRNSVLERLDALRNTTINAAALEYVYGQRWRVNAPMLRTLGEIEGTYLEWSNRLRQGTISRSQSDAQTLALVDAVLTRVLQPFLTEVREYNNVLGERHVGKVSIQPEKPRALPRVKQEEERDDAELLAAELNETELGDYD